MIEHILLGIIGVMAAMLVAMVGFWLMRVERLITNFDGKFDGLSNRLGAVEQGVAGLNGRIDAFGQRLNRMEANGKVT